MKTLKSEKGITIIETMISLLILSVVFIAFSSMYSFNGKIAADNQSNIDATYEAQSIIEEIRTLDYTEALAKKAEYDTNSQIDVEVVPYGPGGSLDVEDPEYIHVICLPGEILIINVDGSYVTTPYTDIDINCEPNGRCTIAYGVNTIVGNTKDSSSNVVVIANTVYEDEGTYYDLDLNTDAYVYIYKASGDSYMTTTGAIDEKIYEGINSYGDSLVEVTVTVYSTETLESTYKISQYVNVKNG